MSDTPAPASPLPATAIEHAPIDALKPHPNNARTHSKRQIKMIAASIERFGFMGSVLVDDDLTIIAGHGRVAAAKSLGLKIVPILRTTHLDADGVRAYMLADNQLALKAGWDTELIAIELQHLLDLDIPAEALGFEAPDVDAFLDAAAAADPANKAGPEDAIPAPAAAAVARSGDLWRLGRHRLVVGDARDEAAYAMLFADDDTGDGAGTHGADVMFTDPPYNVPIDGFAGGKGEAERREFAMASGEMSPAQFTAFLEATLAPAAARLRDGAVAFVCMDWRHNRELQAAGDVLFDALLNICVWTKTNGGLGSLYRSQHELVFVFRKGEGPHLNNVELGRHGRNRTNVWAYAGANAFGGKKRQDELAMHPTVKPVRLIVDALEDVSKRSDIVIDPFGGSGSTLIAAEACGRAARLIEIDPLYCDVIIRRFEAYTGKQARLAATGESFEDVAEARGAVTDDTSAL